MIHLTNRKLGKHLILPVSGAQFFMEGGERGEREKKQESMFSEGFIHLSGKPNSFGLLKL